MPQGSIGPCAKYLCPPGTADDDSDPTTPCKPCAAGTFQDRTGSTSCINWSACVPGTGLVNMPDSTTNALCESCVLGATYSKNSVTVNNLICANVSLCPDDQVESVAPTLSTDRQCDACGDTDGYAVNGRCIPYTVCSEGQQQSVAPTATSDRACAVCPPGTFSNTTGAVTCTQWTECRDGEEYEAGQGTKVTDRQCGPVTTCQLGVDYEVVPPTKTSNRVCATCTVCPVSQTGSSCTLTSDAVCGACAVCGNGTYATAPCTATSNTTCTACPVCNTLTEYETRPCTPTNHTVCTPLTECKATEYEVRVGKGRFVGRKRDSTLIVAVFFFTHNRSWPQHVILTASVRRSVSAQHSSTSRRRRPKPPTANARRCASVGLARM